MDKGAAIAAAARGCLGVRFRLHGRSVGNGLDCVGLAALALEQAGYVVVLPHYGLRSGDVERAERWLCAAGLRAVERRAPGDLVLVRPGPLQLHLMVKVEGGHVHAHAGLRRVVEMPGASPWPVVGHWRMNEEKGEADGDFIADCGGHGAGRSDRWRDRSDCGAGVRSGGVVQAQGTDGATA